MLTRRETSLPSVPASRDADGLSRAYVLFALLCAVLPILGYAAGVAAIDPHYIFGMPGWPRLNAVRPYYEPHIIIAKPYQAWRARPEAVALGSSRAEAGLDPHHPAWGTAKTLNFAMPSSTSYETMLAFTHAVAVGAPLKRAVIGLDFFGFNMLMSLNAEQMENHFAGNAVEEFGSFLDAELRKRGRDPTPRIRTPEQQWNETLYLIVNDDVAKAIARKEFTSGAQHYELKGRAQRRLGGYVPANWDETGYLELNPDVARAVSLHIYSSGYHHYLTAGRTERRQGGIIPDDWNEAGYLAANAGARIRIALGEYHSGHAHYIGRGKFEGRVGGLPPTPSDSLQAQWPALNRTGFQARELWKMVFSISTLIETVGTVLAQSTPPSFNDSGMRVWQGHDKELQALGGAGPFIRRSLLGGGWSPELMAPSLMFCFTNNETGMTMFDPFRFMMRRAYAEGTDLRLFITPIHANVRALFRGLTLSDRYDFWMKELVRINEEEAASAGRQPLPLWDFSGVSAVTREPIPLPGDPTPMHYFWEYSHYRKAAGDLVLDRVFGYSDPARPMAGDFGVRLTGANIDAHIAGSNARLADWAAHDDLAIGIDEVARKPHPNNRQPQVACW